MNSENSRNLTRTDSDMHGKTDWIAVQHLTVMET